MPASREISGRSALTIRTPPAPGGSRIGIFGGSFNPVHAGHAIVAETAVRRLRLDRLWWLVTPGNPLKDHDGLAPLADRLRDVERFATDPRMHVTAFERELGTPYTAATLQFLNTRYAATKFVWVMGADCLAGFHNWQRWRDIAAMMPLAVVDRPGWHLAALASPAARQMAQARLDENQAAKLADEKPPAWVMLTTRLSPLSSTDIRAKPQQ